ncbi:MAG: twin-arginine translocase subunit TatC, partial [Chloroflexia bacterium]|nr:twin-arginine translocase subunit TatC [Chloroflexia bacterium]
MTATSQRPQQVDPKRPEDFSGAEMSLIDHLGELRTRLIRSAVGIILGMVVSFVFINRIYNALINLALPYKVQSLAPAETFTSYIKVSLMLGLVFAMPIIVYQIVAFISPGLTRKERRYLLRALPFVSLLFFGGLAFAYFVVLPSAL